MAGRNFAGKRSKEKAACVTILAYKFCGYPSETMQDFLFLNINHSRGL